MSALLFLIMLPVLFILFAFDVILPYYFNPPNFKDPLRIYINGFYAAGLIYCWIFLGISFRHWCILACFIETLRNMAKTMFVFIYIYTYAKGNTKLPDFQQQIKFYIIGGILFFSTLIGLIS